MRIFDILNLSYLTLLCQNALTLATANAIIITGLYITKIRNTCKTTPRGERVTSNRFTPGVVTRNLF